MGTEFVKEADLCAAFIASLPEGWTAYPETGGFDILLVRASDGFQIGIEAKLRLNAKVLTQAAERASHSYVTQEGPDCRAVLIPDGVSMDLSALAPLLGITVIAMRFDRGVRGYSRLRAFTPALPTAKYDWDDHGWFECCPAKRITLPDWIPDVVAGDSAPVALTPWKIGAIKLVVTLQRRGYLTRQDFAHFKISMSRWTQSGWLIKDGQGGWVTGPYMPDFKAQHPINFDQIAADFEKWKSPAAATQRGLFSAPAQEA